MIKIEINGFIFEIESVSGKYKFQTVKLVGQEENFVDSLSQKELESILPPGFVTEAIFCMWNRRVQ